MEKILILLAFFQYLQGQPPDEDKFTEFMCSQHWQYECGLHPFGNQLINCGYCPGTQVCSVGLPQPNGTIGPGQFGQCGGGCAEVESFQCSNNLVPVMCTASYMAPNSECVPQEDSYLWCCP